MNESSAPLAPSRGYACPTQRPAEDIDGARGIFSALQAQAREQELTLRAPPPEPTTCCGRGCNGCVWEGFFAATEYWRQEALLQLSPVTAAL